MIVRIALKPSIIKYIKYKRGDEPLTYRYKCKISYLISSYFRKQLRSDKHTTPRSNYIEYKLPYLLIKAGHTYISPESIAHFEHIIQMELEEEIKETVHYLVMHHHLKIVNALRMTLNKFGLTDEDINYESVYKQIQRKKKALEEQPTHLKNKRLNEKNLLDDDE